MRLNFIITLLLCTLFIHSEAQLKQKNANKLVELSGVVMSADSLRYIPFVMVNVLNKDVGTIATGQGVFSLFLHVGDTLEFTAKGYSTKYYKIPADLNDPRYNIIQLMTQDTFYSDETILTPAPTRDEFDYAFKNWIIPDDMIEIARKNTEANTLRILSEGLAKDGKEAASAYVRDQWKRTTWLGGTPPQYIFSPLAWAEFLNAWNRGDFKRKKKKKP